MPATVTCEPTARLCGVVVVIVTVVPDSVAPKVGGVTVPVPVWREAGRRVR